MRTMAARRKSELWTSKIKLLTSGSKKTHSRTSNFKTEETKLLIQLWGDPKLQKALITTHRKQPVIMKLADKMREFGHIRSAEEINTRIKNLKCFYNRIKKDIEMGIIKSTTWKYFQAMDEIISRPIFGNRVQQPHLQHGIEEDSNGLRPEKLLPVVDENDVDGSKVLDLVGKEGKDMDLKETLLIPKDVPVNMADMDACADAEVSDVNDKLPKLHQYLQLARKKALPSLPIQRSYIKMSPPSSPKPIETTSPPPSSKSSTIVTIPAAANSATSNSANKISPVLANLLMKTATTNVAPITATIRHNPTTPMKQVLLSNQPATINFGGEEYVCANQSVNDTQTMYTSTSNGRGPIKVLLVNNVQKPITQQLAAAIAASSKETASESEYSSSTPSSESSSYTRSHKVSAAAASHKSGTFKYQKGAPGFRSILQQLVQLQKDTLKVSRQRLKVETKRFALKQRMDARILNILQTMSGNQNNNS